jgi:hypothetical protein
MKTLGLKLSVVVLAIAPVACSSSSSPGGTAGDAGGTAADGGSGATAPTPSITITSPASGATATVTALTGPPAEAVVPIAFTVTNFTLMAPGTCPGGDSDTGCGHVHLTIDGAACTPSGEPYNNATPATAAADGAGASPVNALLNLCPMINGMHTVTLSLHNDTHAPLDGPDGGAIETSVTFMVTGG